MERRPKEDQERRRQGTEESSREGGSFTCGAEERALAQRMDIAVATPGRLIALLNSRATNLRQRWG